MGALARSRVGITDLRVLYTINDKNTENHYLVPEVMMSQLMVDLQSEKCPNKTSITKKIQQVYHVCLDMIKVLCLKNMDMVADFRWEANAYFLP